MVALGHGKSDARGIERNPQTGYISPLLLGYRVPETLLAFANQLLPIAAPHVEHSRSVRTGGAGPSLVFVNDPETLLAAVVAEAARVHEVHGLVGVLAPATRIRDIAKAFGAAGVSAMDITKHGAIEQGIALVSAEAAKGLEFDAVVVVEPAAIVNSGLRLAHPHYFPALNPVEGALGQHSEAQGYRILFVALTRATQHVSIVHSEPLPIELRAPERIPAQELV